MADVAFDTLATARLLQDSGLGDRQAAAITTAIKDGVTGGVATKADLTALRSDIATTEARILQDATKREGAANERFTALETHLVWIKRFGAGILTILVLPWFAELAMPIIDRLTAN